MAKSRKPRRAAQLPPPRSRAAAYWLAAAVAAAVLVYVNALGNGFVLDDTRLIRDNVRIRSLTGVPELFASSYWGVAGAQALYRPVVLASYAVNYAAHGLSATGFIAVNIGLHAAVCALLFALVRGIGGSLTTAGVTALLFAVHPVHVEAVAGMSGRPELLAAGFFLLALYLHRRATTDAAWYVRAATPAVFALALLSKEGAMTLLLVVPLADVLVPARPGEGGTAAPRSRLLGRYLPLAAVAMIYLAVRRAILGGIVIADTAIAPLDNPLVPIGPTPLGDHLGATAGQALMTPFAVIAEYARLMVWPMHLSPDYSYNQIPLVTSAGDLRFLGGLALAAACLGAIAWLWRRHPVAAFGLAFLALTYALVSNLVIRIGTICAERLIYLPSAGVCLVAAAGIAHLAAQGPVRRRAAWAVVAVVLVAASARTLARNRDWRDETTLWASAVRVAPASARVQSEYGRILLARAEEAAAAGPSADAERLYADARAHFETSVRIYPAYSLPLDGLAMIASAHDRFDEANALYGRALRAWPGNFASLANWAALLWDESRRIGARAMDSRRNGHIAESDALLRQADAMFHEALERIDRAIAMMPSYAHAHLVRALILASDPGQAAGAIAEFETVLRFEPNHPQRPLIDGELRRLRAR